ncbi:MAG: hypothetical protein R3A48_15935 [Polyangiales bacterium]
MKRVIGIEVGASRIAAAVAEPNEPPRLVLGYAGSFPAKKAGGARWKWSIEQDWARAAAQERVAELYAALIEQGGGNAEMTVLALSSGYGDARASALVHAFAGAGFPSIRVMDEGAALALGAGRSWLRAPALVVDVGASHTAAAVVSLSDTHAVCLAQEGTEEHSLDGVAVVLRDELQARIERATGAPLAGGGAATLLDELRAALWAHQGGALKVRSAVPGGAEPWELVVPEIALQWLLDELVESVAAHVQRALDRARVRLDTLDRAWFTGGAWESASFRAALESRIHCELRPIPGDLIACGAARFGVELLGASTPTPLPFVRPGRADSTRGLENVIEVDRGSGRAATQPPPRSTLLGSDPPPAAGSMRHTGPPAAAHTLPRDGAFRGARTPVELLGMPLMRAPQEHELATPYLPVLLLQIATAQLTGTLSLTQGGDSARLVISRGGVCAPTMERARMQRVLEWTTGTFSWRDGVVPPALAKHREPTFGFVASGLRTALRGMSDAAVMAAFGPRLSLSPVVIPERKRRVVAMGFGSAEQRAVDHMLDGTKDVEGLLGEGYIGRLSFMRVLLLLEAFGALRWVPPAVDHSEAPADRLKRRLAHMQHEDHFTALGLHWTATHDDVIEAWAKMQELCADGGRWASIDRGVTAQIRARAELAWSALRDDKRRVDYRHALHPDVDETMLSSIVAAQAELLAFRGELKEAKAMRGLAVEMASAPPPTPPLKRG